MAKLDTNFWGLGNFFLKIVGVNSSAGRNFEKHEIFLEKAVILLIILNWANLE